MWHSLGRVTVAASGTPVRATNNETTPAQRYPCQTLFFQQVTGQTGKVYVCDRATANITTGVGVLCVLGVPSGNTTPPWASVSVPSAPAALNANEIWIDADVNGEVCQVSALRN